MKTLTIFFFFFGLFYCCASLNDDASISLVSRARIKRSVGSVVQDAVQGILGTVEIVSAGFLKLVGETLSGICDLTGGHETCKNVAFVVDLLGELSANAAWSSISAHSDKTKRILIYGLIYTVQNEQNMLDEPGVEPIKMKRSEFLDAKHISEFAINVYHASANDTDFHTKNPTAKVVPGSHQHTNVKSSMKLSANDNILFSWFQPEEDNEGDRDNYVPHFMIFTDKSSKSVVIAIKGTDNPKDMILNGVASTTPFLKGSAHKGMAESSERVLKESSQDLKKAFKTYPGYRLVITGHSLGAGVAILTTMKILSRTSPIVVPKNVEVKCIVIAPPPVYHANKPIDQDKYKKHIQIFINRYDVVPRLSLYTLAKMFKAATTIEKLFPSLTGHGEIIKIMSGSQINQTTSQKIIESVDTATVSSFTKLEHPGQIFYLDHAKASKNYKIFQTPKNFFAKMLLRTEMINSHFREAYEKAFANVDIGSLIDDSAAGGPALLSGMMFLIILQVHLFWNQLF